MSKSILNGKSILAVTKDPNTLAVLEKEIRGACPTVYFDRATTFEEARSWLASYTYDLIVLDIVEVYAFEVLVRAVHKEIPVAILTANPLTPVVLKRCSELEVRRYISKETLREIVPYLEEILQDRHLPAWGRFYKDLKNHFNDRWGGHWQTA